VTGHHGKVRAQPQPEVNTSWGRTIRPSPHERRGGWVAFAALLVALAPAIAPHAAALQFQTDQWVTECATGAAASCSIIGAFGGVSQEGTEGSFALAVDVQNAQVAVVGKPYPVKGIIRIDKNPPVECIGPRYCLVASTDAETIIRQMDRGALILVDIFTAKSVFHSSISTNGYRAGVAKIRAEGYRYPLNN
jgi:hypothetical protein